MRHRPPTRSQMLDALFVAPILHEIAHDLSDVGRRRRKHPLALHLAFGAMARLFGSANRLDAELAEPTTWEAILLRYNEGAERHRFGVRADDHARPLLADTYRHVRDHLTSPATLEDLLESFTTHSVALAQSIGLIVENGKGSRTRPHPSRTIYGDGTIVRPLYSESSTGRRDPDAEEHVRHDGAVYGNDLVMVSTRGDTPHQRMILAVGRVHERGHEADVAIDIVRDVVAVAGSGVQAVVYDGAFRGVHHETLMSELGLVVVNKVHAAAANDAGRLHRALPLGEWHHVVRRATCTHTLVAHNGSVHDVTFDDAGALVLSPPLRRHQVRRYERADGRFRFSLGVRVPCPREGFVAWISPHPQGRERGFGRPDQLRLVPESDELFPLLYGLRNDSESINSRYKGTLVARRAAASGWRRQVLDLVSWALLVNSLAVSTSCAPSSWERGTPRV